MAFTAKCTNFDAITQTTQKIEYSLIYGYNFNFGYTMLNFIDDRINPYRTEVYFSWFLQFIFDKIYPNIVFENEAKVLLFQLTKKALSDLLAKDAIDLDDFEILAQVRQVLHQNSPTVQRVVVQGTDIKNPLEPNSNSTS